MKTRPTIIYVSGAITCGDNLPQNVRRGIEAAAALIDRGYVVICPHEKVLGMELLHPMSYEEWMAYDLRCIEICDAIYRMPEWSKGADREVKFAKEIGKPVYTSLESLVACVPTITCDNNLETTSRKGLWDLRPLR
jgi:hypothetical protein